GGSSELVHQHHPPRPDPRRRARPGAHRGATPRRAHRGVRCSECARQPASRASPSTRIAAPSGNRRGDRGFRRPAAAELDRPGAAGGPGGIGRGPLRRLLRRLRALPAVLIPVLTGALDQALALAGSMDSRGYARAHRSNRVVGVLLVFALFAAAGGTYGLLDAAAPAGLGAGLLIGGFVVAVAASILASR